jgi:predicted RNase H-like HicB family nuclease
MRLCDYSERIAMKTIRILHSYAPGYGWSFESPDIPGLTGGGDAYDAARAESAAKFALACAAEEQDLPAPTELAFEHYVPAGVAVAA